MSVVGVVWHGEDEDDGGLGKRNKSVGIRWP
jgi:hypothetical protein